MANEIEVHGATGKIFYGLIRNSAGWVYYPSGGVFQAYNATNYANYATSISFSEQGLTGVYLGNFPLLAGGQYRVDVRKQIGGSPAVSDTAYGTCVMNWSGTAEIFTVDPTSLLNSIKSKTDGLPSDPADASDIAALFTALTNLVNAIKAKTDNLPADPADESNTQGRFSNIDSALNIIASYIDTEVAAIKAKTDALDNAAIASIKSTVDLYIADIATNVTDIESSTNYISAIKSVTDKLLSMIADPDNNNVYEFSQEALTNIPESTGGFSDDDRTLLNSIESQITAGAELSTHSPDKRGRFYIYKGFDFKTINLQQVTIPVYGLPSMVAWEDKPPVLVKTNSVGELIEFLSGKWSTTDTEGKYIFTFEFDSSLTSSLERSPIPVELKLMAFEETTEAETFAGVYDMYVR